MKLLLLLAFKLLVSFSAFAQADNSEMSLDTLKSKRRFCHNPMRGIYFQLGTMYNKTDNPNFEIRTGLSSVFNFYFTRQIPLIKHSLSLVSGLGLGFEAYQFKKRNLIFDPAYHRVYSDQTPFRGYTRSALNTNYIDIPLELQFASSSKFKKALKIGIGVKGGVMYSSSNKLRYIENDKSVKVQLSDINASRFRYGVTGRIGIGVFSLWGYYSLSSLLKEKYFDEVQPIVFGISLYSF